MWKTVAEPDRPHMTMCGVCTLRAGNLRLQTPIQLFNTYYFSTATMVVRTHINVTLYVHCLVLYYENGKTTLLKMYKKPGNIITTYTCFRIFSGNKAARN